MNHERSVLVFSIAYEPYVGGAEVAIREIAARSARKFAVVTMRFSHTDAKREMVANVDVIRVGPMWLPASIRKIVFMPLAVIAGWRMRRRVSFAWGMMANYAGLAAWMFSKVTGKRLLLTLQEGDDMDALLRRRSVRLMMLAFKDLFARAHRIQCISNYLCDFAARFAAREKISLVPNGVDLERFSIDDIATTRSASREELGLKPDAKMLVTSSRLVTKNGIDRVIRALPLMEGVEFAIFGEGPDESSLRSLALSLGVADRVHFLGFRAHADLPRLLAVGDAFVRLSRTEGLGNSFIEAMAMGLPVACTAVGGIVDFARDSDTAVVCVSPDDATITARDLMRALGDTAEAIAVRGQKVARDTYGWDGVVTAMEKEFLLVGGDTPHGSVLIATGIFPPDVGGPATHAAKIAQSFAAQDRGVSVVCFGEVDDVSGVSHCVEERVFVTRVSKRAARWTKWYRYARELVRAARRADVVYAFDLTTAGFPAALYCAFADKPLLIRMGGDPTWERTVERGERFISFPEYFKKGLNRVDRPWLHRIVRFVLRTARNVSVDHEAMRNHVIEQYCVHPSRVTVVPNPSEVVSAGTPGTRDPFVVLYAGRIVGYKNLPNLVRAMAVVRQTIPQAQLRIVGDGPSLGELRNAIVDAGSTVDVVVEKSMKRSELEGAIDAASVIVMPALSEFNPNTALDALSRMRPVAISYGNGLSRQVPQSWMFDPMSPESIAKALCVIHDSYEAVATVLEEMPSAPTWEQTLARHAAFVDAVHTQS
jgi:glycosyltransferase involved in cell wall biosynthesis